MKGRSAIYIPIVMVAFVSIVIGEGTLPLALPNPENECVVHPLPAEVVEQLLKAANSSLDHLEYQHKDHQENQGNHKNIPNVSSIKELANLGASPDLLLLLLHSMEREQARHDREISRLMQESDFPSEPLVKSRSNTNNQDSESRIGDDLLEAVIGLQRNVSRLLTQQLESAKPEPSKESFGHLQWPAESQNYYVTPTNDCYPVDTWPRDCYDLAQLGKNESGVYTIYPHRCRRSVRGVRVWCDFGGANGTWTVVVSRRPSEEPVLFSKGWTEYRQGFGDPETEQWIGNDALHDLTNGRPQILRVEMADWDGNQRYAEYRTFLVEDDDAEYRLHVGLYSGNAGDSFGYHDNMRFSTSDRDNDKNNGNCASSHKGGFWFNTCHHTNPTGLLLEKQKTTKGVTWHSWYPDWTTLKELSFKLKPKPCY